MSGNNGAIDVAEVRTAIVNAYNRTTFDRMLSDRLDFRRANHVADGAFTDVVDGVVRHFVEEGREAYLIAEVAADRPAKREIQVVYRKYASGLLNDAWRDRVESEVCEKLARCGLLPSTELQRGGVRHEPERSELRASQFGGFQKQIRTELPELDAVQWSSLLLRQTCRVCRIELHGTPIGTGFLVGAETVLTSHHVVRDAIVARAPGSAVTFLFDYWRGSDGAEASGTRVAARGGWPDWHLDSSPPLSAQDEHAGSVEPGDDQLDHAVIALDRPLGDLPVVPGGPRRGWIEVTRSVPTLVAGMPIAILQHPRSAPVKLTFDTRAVQHINTRRTRIRYTTNTDAGSSGSPCFDVQLGLVAMHHFSDPERGAPRYNQGTPSEAIHRRLAGLGKLNVLGGKPS